MLEALRALRHRVDVRHRSSLDNAYHCCVQKTASRWLKRVLDDVRIYRYSGLTVHDHESRLPAGHDPRDLRAKRVDVAFPRRRIVGPLYVSHQGYRSIAKPERHRAFCVVRDPRDIVVSWYWSVARSHEAMGVIARYRETLAGMDERAGLAWALRELDRYGLFAGLASWAGAEDADPRVRMLRYEDLTGPEQARWLRELLRHLDVAMPEPVLGSLLEDYRFERFSDGRRRGAEDRGSHYRRGEAGDWRAHLDAGHVALFRALAGDLPERLGYR